MTLRSHDQFNTTIYGLDDRYRGVYGGRRVIFLNADDIKEANLAPEQWVDITSHFDGKPGQRIASKLSLTTCRAAVPVPIFQKRTYWFLSCKQRIEAIPRPISPLWLHSPLTLSISATMEAVLFE